MKIFSYDCFARSPLVLSFRIGIVVALMTGAVPSVSAGLIEDAPFFPVFDPIHDDYVETEAHRLHSTGLLSYGSHNNTFHLRQFFLRYNHQRELLQFFATLNGQKDTHDPEVDYSYFEGEANLYDYGVTLGPWKYFFVSARGAATYRMNYHTFLLIPPYYFPGNDAEIDSPPQYLPIFRTGPGARLGFRGDGWEFGYSQGDYRHTIPMAFMARRATDRYYVRALVQLENEDPRTHGISENG